MTSVKIMLNTINDVKSFVNIVTKCPYEVDLVSGRYAVDGKSIMGIFSLDLAKAIQANIHGDDCKDFLESIKPFIVE